MPACPPTPAPLCPLLSNSVLPADHLHDACGGVQPMEWRGGGHLRGSHVCPALPRCGLAGVASWLSAVLLLAQGLPAPLAASCGLSTSQTSVLECTAPACPPTRPTGPACPPICAAAVIQYMPNFFFGSLLLWFGIEITRDWLVMSFYKMTHIGVWGARGCVERAGWPLGGQVGWVGLGGGRVGASMGARQSLGVQMLCQSSHSPPTPHPHVCVQSTACCWPPLARSCSGAWRAASRQGWSSAQCTLPWPMRGARWRPLMSWTAHAAAWCGPWSSRQEARRACVLAGCRAGRDGAGGRAGRLGRSGAGCGFGGILHQVL